MWWWRPKRQIVRLNPDLWIAVAAELPYDDIWHLLMAVHLPDHIRRRIFAENFLVQYDPDNSDGLLDWQQYYYDGPVIKFDPVYLDRIQVITFNGESELFADGYQLPEGLRELAFRNLTDHQNVLEWKFPSSLTSLTLDGAKCVLNCPPELQKLRLTGAITLCWELPDTLIDLTLEGCIVITAPIGLQRLTLLSVDTFIPTMQSSTQLRYLAAPVEKLNDLKEEFVDRIDHVVDLAGNQYVRKSSTDIEKKIDLILDDIRETFLQVVFEIIRTILKIVLSEI